MTSYVYDFSERTWPRALPPVYGAGFIRYLGTPDAPSGKNITREEYEWRLSHGQPLAFVYELDRGWWRGGASAGAEAARACADDARNNLGISSPLPFTVYAAIDQDAQPSDLPTIDAALRAMDHAFVIAPLTYLWSVGVYGEAMVIDHCVGGTKTAQYGWQTVAWSGGRISSSACLLQLAGYVYPEHVQCDQSRVLTTDWGQFPYLKLQPTNGGTDVTPEEHALLKGAHDSYYAITKGEDATGRKLGAGHPNLAAIQAQIEDLAKMVSDLSRTVNTLAKGNPTQ